MRRPQESSGDGPGRERAVPVSKFLSLVLSANGVWLVDAVPPAFLSR